jgi:hypothetical protein
MSVGFIMKMTKDEVTPFFSGFIREMPQDMSKLLDTIALDAKMMLSNTAPKGKTGRLSSEISITAYHNPEARVIEPTASNFGSPQRKYASAVETGATGYVTLPNLTSIAEYYGLSLFIEGNRMNPFVIAIAKKIREGNTAGASPRPFVQKTVNWLNNIKIPERCSNSFDRIIARKY